MSPLPWVARPEFGMARCTYVAPQANFQTSAMAEPSYVGDPPEGKRASIVRKEWVQSNKPVHQLGIAFLPTRDGFPSDVDITGQGEDRVSQLISS